MTNVRTTSGEFEPGSDRAADAEVTLATLLSVPLRYPRILVAVPATALLIASLILILSGPRHVARSIFLPEGGQTQTTAGGLAAQLGISLPASGGESPAFYTELLSTTALLQRAAETEYDFEGDPPRTARLVELLGQGGDTPEARLRRTVAYLRDNISTVLERGSGLIRLSVRAPWPKVSEQINRRLLELLNDFNVDKRQSRVRAEREFVEARLQEVQGQLLAAESELQAFLNNNRRFESSSQLSFEAARLQRRVDLQQQVYVTLAQSLEQARIEQVRTTPVITVVDPPEGSARRVSNWRVTIILVTMFGIMLALIAAFGMELVRRQREQHPEEFQELSGLRKSALYRLTTFRSPESGAPIVMRNRQDDSS